VTITESPKNAPEAYSSTFRFDESRDLWISAHGTANSHPLIEMLVASLIFVFFLNYELEFLPLIASVFLLAMIIWGLYLAFRLQINQIEIDIPRSRIRLVQPSLFLRQRISYIHFSTVRFLRSTMISDGEYRFNALELVLKSGDASVEIARFNPTPTTDGSLSFRQIVFENSEAKALRKQFCSLTGIRDFGFLSSILANPIDMESS
jgi:hypothetical protein